MQALSSPVQARHSINADARASPSRAPNTLLIGVPGGRHHLDTPALLLDVDGLNRNISRMARFATANRVQLRPHVKTHKSIQVAKLQVAAGAVGVSCATLGEAETMVAAGIPGVLITSPIVTEGKIKRLIELARHAPPSGLLVVVDHCRNVADLAIAAAEMTQPLHVLIDFAAGYHRTGVADVHAVMELAQQILGQPTLHLRGLQAYAGNIQHIAEHQQRAKASAAVRASVRRVIDTAMGQGIAFEIVTGAGTGSSALDAQERVFTELQVGSYVFMDAEYTQVLIEGPNFPPFEVALFVQTSVVSVNHRDWVTVDGGTKSFATDSGVPVVADGAQAGSRYAFWGDEHGKLIPAARRPELGERVEFVSPHCDPTVNLHAVYHVVSGDTLVDIWPIDARGR